MVTSGTQADGKHTRRSAPLRKLRPIFCTAYPKAGGRLVHAVSLPPVEDARDGLTQTMNYYGWGTTPICQTCLTSLPVTKSPRPSPTVVCVIKG